MSKPVSQRRRNLMIAGLAGAVTSAGVFAGSALENDAPNAAMVDGNLVVSGRIVDIEARAIPGALVEIARGAATTTDGDGRFVLSLREARRRSLHVRVSSAGYRTHVTPLTRFDRDDAGTLRTTLGLSIARA